MEAREILWREIEGQAEVWKWAVQKVLQKDRSSVERLWAHRHIYWIGCGSSYHAGLIAKFTYDSLLDKRSICATSADIFIYPGSYIRQDAEKDVFLLVSRTGETSETLLAMEEIKKHNGHTVALTTFSGSTLSRECDYSIVIEEGQEKSITATRSVTASTTILIGLCFLMGNQRERLRNAFSVDMLDSTRFEEYSTEVSSIVNENDIDRFVFLGSGPFLGVAKEGELKVKEMSLTCSESHETLEYRHGHNALLDEKSLVVLFLSDEGFSYEIKTAIDLRRTGAYILAIGVKERLDAVSHAYGRSLDIHPDLDYLMRPVLCQIFGHMLGYYQALKKNVNPAEPRNLDYCVTL